MTAVPDETEGSPETSSQRALHRRVQFSRWFRWHLAVSLLIFFGSAFAGYAILDAIPIDQLADLVPANSPFPEEITFPFIALNNLRVLAITLFGTVTLGLLSLFVLFVNGAVVGAVVAIAAEETGWAFVFAALAPHGVLELSAFFVAAAIGLRVTHRIIRYLLGWDDSPLTRVELFELAVLVVILVLMIVVAAWIEVNVTPGVIERVTGQTV